ncbi:MAG: phosphotransferase family protein [Desulfovibrionaceae bacterium]
MNKVGDVRRYLLASGRFGGELDVQFLAAGEYNENYLVDSGRGRFVLRLNHGSQLGLDNQIGYEFAVLQAVAPSGVTPRPHFVDPDPEGLDHGVLLMDFLPGRPLDYDRDLHKAARVFARVHALAPDERLLAQPEPVAGIGRECEGLIRRFPDHPMVEVRDRLLRFHEEIMALSEAVQPRFAAEAEVMANTEVNSGNFLVDGEAARLVDWEKAVRTVRYQDLGHFTVMTTTRWKTDKVLSEEEKLSFLERYRLELLDLGAPAPELEELRELTAVLERTILLRALSWCFMAWYEYTESDRGLQNPDTFRRITQYLDESACIVGSKA